MRCRTASGPWRGPRPVVDTVTAADLDRPTPCARWDVRALVEHMIWMCDVFAAGPGRCRAARRPRAAGHRRPAARYAAASAAALQGWRTTEWAEMMLALPFSTLPAAIGVRVFVGDQLIHTLGPGHRAGPAFA